MPPPLQQERFGLDVPVGGDAGEGISLVGGEPAARRAQSIAGCQQGFILVLLSARDILVC